MSRPPARPLTGGGMALFVATVFTTASTIHYQTPMLGRIAAEFGATTAQVGWIPTLSFAGFLTGTLLLVPLGDRYDKRRLILGKIAVLIACTIVIGIAPSLSVLWAASFVLGVGTSVSQHVVPLVAELTPPEARGSAMGTVLMGLFLGILFARVAGGLVAATLGWRWMYGIASAMLMAIAIPLWLRLPVTVPRTTQRYPELIASLVHLYRRGAAVRQASLTQMLVGFGYGGFWATLAPMLLAEHGLGPAAAGLIGVPAAAGILVARPAGRWMDRRGVAPVVTLGLGLVMLAFAVFSFATHAFAAIVAGAILLDCGVRTAMVANQTLVNSHDPSSRSRLNTLFAAHMWGGNAIGAFLASTAFAHGGWWGVCAIGFAASSCALVLHRRAQRVRAAGAT